MCIMISCLVSGNATVYAKNGVYSHSEIAQLCKVNEDKCLKYEYDLKERKLRQDFDMDLVPFKAKDSHDQAASNFFNQCAGIPELLLAFVKKGNWRSAYLIPLLNTQALVEIKKVLKTAIREHDKVCYDADKKFYNACRKTTVQNFEKVCNAGHEEIEKVKSAAGKKFDKVIAVAWANLFQNPLNRIPIWQN